MWHIAYHPSRLNCVYIIGAYTNLFYIGLKLILTSPQGYFANIPVVIKHQLILYKPMINILLLAKYFRQQINDIFNFLASFYLRDNRATLIFDKIRGFVKAKHSIYKFCRRLFTTTHIRRSA